MKLLPQVPDTAENVLREVLCGIYLDLYKQIVVGDDDNAYLTIESPEGDWVLSLKRPS